MARIKFLDILEETKTKPLYADSNANLMNTNHDTISEDSISEFPKKRERVALEDTQDKLATLRERSLLRDSGVAYESATPASSSSRSTERSNSSKAESQNMLKIDDNKMLLTGALFVLFGGMLFLSGYWVGKSLTNNVRAEREMLMAQSLNNMQRETPSTLPTLPTQMAPVTSTVDTIPSKQPVEVIEPAVVPTARPAAPKVTPKPAPAPTKEFIIQISAHSTIESARATEDRLRSAGFSAYTSESVIGDNVFFRVRVRGFSSRKAAQDTLASIKAQNLGQDGFVLTLE